MKECTTLSSEPASGRKPVWWAFLLIVAMISMAPSVGQAQVTTSITPSGLNTQVSHADHSYNITGGTRPGGGPNLLHSFGDFSIGPGDTANFSTHNTPAGTVPIANILGRVTGGNISNIYGTLKTTEFGNANLFVMNPSGIILGPGASLSVGGSVSFTTAQYIRLFDGLFNGANFYANPANDGLANSILTIDASAFEFVSGSPAGYGFLTAPDSNATITVQGSNLSVPSGQSISLIGGKVVIEGGAKLSAPNGSIKLASAASPGEFDAALLSSLPNVDGTSFTSAGSISLASGSSIDVHGASTVWIKGGQLVLSLNEATLSTSGNPVQSNAIALRSGSSIITSNSGPDPGADVQLVSSNIHLGNESVIVTQTSGPGRGGNIHLTTDSLTLVNRSQIFTTNSGLGKVGGDLFLNVGTLRLQGGDLGGSQIGSINRTGVDLDGDGLVDVTGVGGNITIQGVAQGPNSTATSVTLSGGSLITSKADSESGNGGGISIRATSLNLGEGSLISSSTTGTGQGGNIVLSVQQLRLIDDATILSSTSSGHAIPAAGGKVIVQGLEGPGSMASAVQLSGPKTVIATDSDSSGGVAGDITVNARTVTLTNGATIASGSSTSAGAAGKVTVTADSIVLSADGQIYSRSFAQGSGQVTITADQLTMDKGSIDTSTSSETGGRGGDVVINSREVNLINGSRISSESNFFSTDQAGNITLHVSTLDLAKGSVISSSSTGTGNAGSITIEAPGPARAVTITDSSLLTTAENAGQGGSIMIHAPNLTLKNATISASVKDINPANPNDGATLGTGNVTLTGSTIDMTGGTISAATTGARNAGTVSLNADSFAMTNGTITTNTSNSGNAGTITILTTGKGVGLFSGSSITSETTAGGNAGQVFLTAPTLTIDNATMTTSTSSTGHAGDILTKVGTLTMTNGSEISSSSTGAATGNAGSLTIQGLASPASAVSLTNSSLLTSAAHTGQGGRISVDATNLLLDNARVSASVKDVPGNEQPTVGTANIALAAESMIMKNGRITAESLGSRNAGNILINSPAALGKHFEMSSSQINTSATLADGGNIEVYATDMIRLTDSTLTSSVGNPNKTNTQGGNITIDPDFVVLQRGNIRANAFAGSGGAIDITSGLFLADASSVVDASSTLGVSGTVQINSPINNLSSVVARLPESLLEVQALLRASCAARLSEGATSSFVERGRDGIPAGPDGLLASPYLPTTVSQSSLQHPSASARISTISPQRLFGRGMPSSVTLFSDRPTCSP